MPEQFTITDDHLKLARRMYVGWQDCETGAPEIDPKRPYGNSSVALDVAEILGWETGDEITAEQGERASAVHRQMETVLQIALKCGRFDAGEYVSERYGEWRLATPPQPVSGDAIDRFLPAGDGVIDCETGHHVSDYDSETLMDFLNALASSPSQPEGVVIEGESIEATSATSDTLDLRIVGGEIVVPKSDGFSPVELPPGPVTVTITPKEQA